MPQRRAPLAERFWRHVNKSDNGCWVWAAYCGAGGYGRLMVAGVPQLTHRLSWLLHFGPIPDGLMVCHHCDNPPCVRPDHLFLGTAAHNVRDMIRKGRRVVPTRTGIQRPAAFADVVRLVGGRRRLSDEDIADALRRRAGGESFRSIARSLGVAHSNVVRLVNGLQWRDHPSRQRVCGAEARALP